MKALNGALDPARWVTDGKMRWCFRCATAGTLALTALVSCQMLAGLDDRTAARGAMAGQAGLPEGRGTGGEGGTSGDADRPGGSSGFDGQGTGGRTREPQRDEGGAAGEAPESGAGTAGAKAAGGTEALGGAETGGSGTGDVSSAGTAGAPSGWGGAFGSGGDQTGAAGATGGEAAGGEAAGGTATGGVGGSASGGVATGGVGGATATGGVAAGGRATGGVGGSASGGAAAGGAATGGQASGGGGGGSAGFGGGGGASSGCGLATIPDPCDTSGSPCTLDAADIRREFYVVLPDDYDASHPYPVVFQFHPFGGNAQQAMTMYGIRPNFPAAIYVTPEGLPVGEIGQGFPNTNGQDEAMTRAIMADIEAKYCVDMARYYATGFSYGGAMSYTAACNMSDVFRAIGAMSGAAVSGAKCTSTTPARPVAVWATHGAEDDTLQISMAEPIIDALVANNGCGSTTHPVAPAPCVEYDGCQEGYPVVWCVREGDGHSIPSFAAAAIAEFFQGF